MRFFLALLFLVCLYVSAAYAQCCPGGCPADPQPPKVEQGTLVEGPITDVIDIVKRRPLKTIIKKEIYKMVPPTPAPVTPTVPDNSEGTYRGNYRMYHTDRGSLILTPIIEAIPDVCAKAGDFRGGPRPGPGPMPQPPTPNYHDRYGGYRHDPYYNPWRRPWWLPPINIVLGPDGQPVTQAACSEDLSAEKGAKAGGPVRKVLSVLGRVFKHKPIRHLIGRLQEKKPVRHLIGRLLPRNRH